MSNAVDLLAVAFDVPREQIPTDASLDSYERWDSLGHVSILMKIEETLGRELEAEEALAIVDIASVQTLLDKAHA